MDSVFTVFSSQTLRPDRLESYAAFLLNEGLNLLAGFAPLAGHLFVQALQQTLLVRSNSPLLVGIRGQDGLGGAEILGLKKASNVAPRLSAPPPAVPVWLQPPALLRHDNTYTEVWLLRPLG